MSEKMIGQIYLILLNLLLPLPTAGSLSQVSNILIDKIILYNFSFELPSSYFDLLDDAVSLNSVLILKILPS